MALKYFVKLTEDGKRLVPGSLIAQEVAPPKDNGSFVDINKITQDFPENYFYKVDSLKRPVPGYFIVAKSKPVYGSWKQIVKAPAP